MVLKAPSYTKRRLDMSSDIEDIFPVSFQKSIISGNLNSTLLFLFLSGKETISMFYPRINCDFRWIFWLLWFYNLHLWCDICIWSLKYTRHINQTTAFTPQSHKKIVTATLTALFATTFTQMIIQWYYTNICLVGTTEDRLDTFLLTASSPPLGATLAIIMQGVSEMLADALLVSTESLSGRSAGSWPNN